MPIVRTTSFKNDLRLFLNVRNCHQMKCLPRIMFITVFIYGSLPWFFSDDAPGVVSLSTHTPRNGKVIEHTTVIIVAAWNSIGSGVEFRW